MDAESSYRLIDDEGNLFGIVNVVDALVVLLVLSVSITGVALISMDNDQTPQTEHTTSHVTLDLGRQPPYLAAAISEGDSFSPAKDANLTVTDVHLAPGGNQTHVVLGVTLRGVANEQGTRYANAPLWLDREIDINTSTYNVTGRISDINDETALRTNTTTVVVQRQQSVLDASEVNPGDRVTVASRTVGTVTDAAVYPAAEGNGEILLVEATLQTYSRRGIPYFGGTQLRSGERIRISTASYVVDGHLKRVGGGLKRDELGNRTKTTETTPVDRLQSSVSGRLSGPVDR
ncbi:DUF4330 family protein [Haloarcula amylovorans]|uniref:DUF4330 family protein n=1 Tax=Haloarcula amylovorans TaxID=2562280 RepID=UPI0010764655|nr:DUF4330 family protein [Halomicroarcula amylolytica]